MRCYLILSLVFLAWAPFAFAQSAPQNPPLIYGQIPTAGQWNQWFEQKQDYLGYIPFSTGGGTLTGEITTAPSTSTLSGLNIGVGVAPSSPMNGDTWMTTSGLYYKVGTTTYGPIGGAGWVSASQLAAGAASTNLSANMSGDATITSAGALTITALSGTPISSYALLASPAFTGSPTGPTQSPGDNSTKLATDAFVATSFAPIASPSLTGLASITYSGSGSSPVLSISGASDTSGACIKLTGNGSTTPVKYLCALNGLLYIESNSGSEIAIVDDVGDVSANGYISAGSSVSGSGFISTGTLPTNTGSCAINNVTGGASAGTFKANGSCASGTVILNFSVTAPNGWSCFAQDRTTITDLIRETATSGTTATFSSVTMASSDVVQFACTAY